MIQQMGVHVPVLHTSPVAQFVPSATLLHCVVLALGWQLWQALVGFGALDE
jgi:hypothetical protein